ncbi:MAG: hypothetical protein M0R34_08420 [Candidatus Marinimicrobia bacterium]|nr:hypothetical protein [Candidatus Neomarinimicrobiota bacterium]
MTRLTRYFFFVILIDGSRCIGMLSEELRLLNHGDDFGDCILKVILLELRYVVTGLYNNHVNLVNPV